MKVLENTRGHRINEIAGKATFPECGWPVVRQAGQPIFIHVDFNQRIWKVIRQVRQVQMTKLKFGADVIQAVRHDLDRQVSLFERIAQSGPLLPTGDPALA
ncbi:MAG: hypothetical protein WDN30_16800 [Pararobbsia sp.]